MRKLTTLIVILLTTCAMQAQKESIIYRESDGRNIEPLQNAVIVPLVADLELISQTRIEYTETFEGIITRAVISDIDSYKKLVLLNAMKKYKADTMIAALININTREDGGALIVTVTGFPAKYTNFRSMTKDDTWLWLVEDSNYIKSTAVVR